MSYFESSSVLLDFNWLDLVCLNVLSSYLFGVFSGQVPVHFCFGAGQKGEISFDSRHYQHPDLEDFIKSACSPAVGAVEMSACSRKFTKNTQFLKNQKTQERLLTLLAQ